MLVSQECDNRCRLSRVNNKCKFSTVNEYFSLTDCLFFFKINRVEAFDEMDKLCKFHENPTRTADSSYRVNKKKTNARTDGNHSMT